MRAGLEEDERVAAKRMRGQRKSVGSEGGGGEGGGVGGGNERRECGGGKLVRGRGASEGGDASEGSRRRSTAHARREPPRAG